jgi:hypothetical protein
MIERESVLEALAGIVVRVQQSQFVREVLVHHCRAEHAHPLSHSTTPFKQDNFDPFQLSLAQAKERTPLGPCGDVACVIVTPCVLSVMPLMTRSLFFCVMFSRLGYPRSPL